MGFAYDVHTRSFGIDPTQFVRVDDPIVILERVHGLKDRRDSSNVRIDLGITQEIRGEIGIQLGLYIGRSVDPKGGIEETMVQKLLQQEIRVIGGTRDEVFGEFEERLEQLQSQVIPGTLAQQMGDHQKSTTRDHLLLNTWRALNQFANEAHQRGTRWKQERKNRSELVKLNIF